MDTWYLLLLALSDRVWWKELGRFNPEPLSLERSCLVGAIQRIPPQVFQVKRVATER